MLPFDGQVQGRLQVDVLQVEPSAALTHQQLGHFDVVVERRQMQRRVAVVLLLVDDPRPGQFRQQDPHGAERVEREREREKKHIEISIETLQPVG